MAGDFAPRFQMVFGGVLGERVGQYFSFDRLRLILVLGTARHHLGPETWLLKASPCLLLLILEDSLVRAKLVQLLSLEQSRHEASSSQILSSCFHVNLHSHKDSEQHFQITCSGL